MFRRTHPAVKVAGVIAVTVVALYALTAAMVFGAAWAVGPEDRLAEVGSDE